MHEPFSSFKKATSSGFYKKKRIRTTEKLFPLEKRVAIGIFALGSSVEYEVRV